MKKSLYTGALVVVFAFAFSVHAAFDDVVFEEPTDLLLTQFFDGDEASDTEEYTITVGEGSEVESIEASTYGFTLVLQNDSLITLRSADRLAFTYSSEAETTESTCNEEESELAFTVASEGETNIEVYFTGDVCVIENEGEDNDDDADGDSGSISSGHRHSSSATQNDKGTSGSTSLESLQIKLIELLKELIVLLAEQQNT